jgi:hypothetical protein
VFIVRSRPVTVSPSLAVEARPVAGRWIDPRGQRFGAATSAATLILAVALGWWPLMTAVGIALAVSSALGTRWFPFSRPWPVLRRALGLGPSELEHEIPPRFAQAMGATFLAIGTALLASGSTPWGWLPVVVVVTLQVLLAATGFCLGCRLFFLRWWVPDRFARLIGRAIEREKLVIVDPPRR